MGSGNHQFDNTQNTGRFIVAPAGYVNPKQFGLMDLATFNNFSNAAGAQAQFTGQHAVNNFNNAEKGTVVFNDHKDGLFTAVKNANNAGNMKVSGLHTFENAQNSGNLVMEQRQFDKDGNPVKSLLLL